MISPALPIPPAALPYLLDVQRSDWGALLAPFSPPVPGSGSVAIVSLFGDVFLEVGGGEIWWINAQAGQVETAAPSLKVFLEKLETEHDRYLRTALADALTERRMALKEGMLYGLKQPASEGGRWDPDNIGAAPIAEAFAYWGDQFRRAQAAAKARSEQPTKKKGWFN